MVMMNVSCLVKQQIENMICPGLLEIYPAPFLSLYSQHKLRLGKEKNEKKEKEMETQTTQSFTLCLGMKSGHEKGRG